MSDPSHVYRNLGFLLNVANGFHDTLVLALTKYMEIDPYEGAILFAPRNTGDLKDTFCALIKHRSGGDTEIVNNICGAIGSVNKAISRTNHVHGRMSKFAAPVGKTPEEMGATFKRPNLSGGKFSFKDVNYGTSKEFSKFVQKAHEELIDLGETLEITFHDWNIYINLGFDELAHPYHTRYDPPPSFQPAKNEASHPED